MQITWATTAVIPLLFISFSALAQAEDHRARQGNFIEWQEPAAQAPQGIDKARVISSIQLALVMRSWRTIEHNQLAQYFDVELPVRAHVARLRIDYSDHGDVRFMHQEGENLPVGCFIAIPSPTTGEYTSEELVRRACRSDGKLAVHQNYDEWVQQLVRTVAGVFQLTKAEMGLLN